MTGWYLIAGYSLLGFIYFVGAIAGQILGSLTRPATEGHLDIRFRLGQFGSWFVVSAILIAPIAIAYAGKPSTSYGGRLAQTNTMLIMYMVIALVWIIKLQFQIDKIADLGES